ncbi:uncharacterized protein LOC125443161 [Sphaerodactylus townsendi]|uniref:Uncharacterized protein n=1 Tax=Sphaerodactylus townsendi TaxID=933632 RepID=A0ACB8FYJ2_9SAUR|nr:uncharacterized protein LOC125443161 [Sphaerodactylus townsendi]XP_048371078.1 uncharacterized protein LOC125443161 [Sphaerodactylus townsendi]
METLDEFDNEYPLIISFCERISPWDFEKQSLNYTQKSLQDLYTQMEQNPRICERILRKRKQVENEDAGLVQYLKAKFFTVLQGDMNYSNLMEEMEMGEKVEQLKREMQKASDYAYSAKSMPWQQLERRTRKNTLLGGFSPSQTSLADPHLATMPRIFGSFPKQVERSSDSSMDLKQLWAGMSSVNQKSMVDLRPLILNPGGFRPTYLGSNSFCRLKYSSFPRTPVNSPTSSSQSAGPSNSGSVFNTPILAKFRDNKDDEKDNENLGPGSNYKEP